jgi:hypothetical protein
MQPSQGDVRRLHRLPYHPYQLAIQRIKVNLLTQVHGEAGEEEEPTSGLEPLTPAPATSLLAYILTCPSASGFQLVYAGLGGSGRKFVHCVLVRISPAAVLALLG